MRREIHQNAELSFCEHKTASYIETMLNSCDIPHSRVAGTGVLAHISSGKSNGRVVVLRADIDALPIEEATDTPYRCTTGAMHACGHDLHTAWLLGAAMALHKMRDRLSCDVLALFQPGEEKAPGGASYVLNEVDFTKYGSPIFVGQHVAPEITAGEYGIREGLYMASADEIHIDIIGKGGHGALINTFTDPVVAMASMLSAMQQVVSRLAPPQIPTVLSFGRVIADGATNVIPEKVEISGTLRTFSQEWRLRAKDRIVEIAQQIAAAHGCKAEVRLPDGFPSVINDVTLTQMARTKLAELVGSQKVNELDLRMTSEDFGHYCTKFPSLFLRVGVGYDDGRNSGSLHNVHFNPNEDALVYGMASMVAIAMELAK